MSRRQYPKHKGDSWDRFITERSKGPDGKFSFARFCELFDSLDCREFIPDEGTNGTRRMTAGIQLRNYFPDGVLVFRDGSTVTLDIRDEP